MHPWEDKERESVCVCVRERERESGKVRVFFHLEPSLSRGRINRKMTGEG